MDGGGTPVAPPCLGSYWQLVATGERSVMLLNPSRVGRTSDEDDDGGSSMKVGRGSLGGVQKAWVDSRYIIYFHEF